MIYFPRFECFGIVFEPDVPEHHVRLFRYAHNWQEWLESAGLK